MKRVISANKLQINSKIGIVAPASGADRTKIMEAIKFVRSQGYSVVEGKSIYANKGYLAGEDDLRSSDINEMFENEDIDAILCLRGGYGSPRILDKIDYNNIKRNPKIFIGYSDITALHIAIHQNTGLITFHGPMLTSDLINPFRYENMKYLTRILENENNNIELINPQGFQLRALTNGSARGKLIGGNLSMLCSTLGTPYEIDTTDCLLFLEEIGEEPYRIDRMLTQLRLAGKLNSANGIILGSFNNCLAKDKGQSLSLQQVIDDIIVGSDRPILMGCMAGHCTPNITLPIGASALMDCENLTLSIKGSYIK